MPEAERLYLALCELNDSLKGLGVHPLRMPSLIFHPEDEARVKDALKAILVDRTMAMAGFAIRIGE